MEIKLNGTSLSIITTVIIAALGGSFLLGFYINNARVEHQKEIVEEYKKSSQLDAPNLLSSLRQSANALTLSASERHAFDEARVRVDEFATRIGSCNSELKSAESNLTKMKENYAQGQAQCSTSIKNLKAELDSYVKESTDFKINIGEAIELIPNKVMLGVGSVYSSFASINLNSESININIGDSRNITSNNRTCTLWLTRLDNKTSEAFFKLYCPIQS